MCKRVIKTFIIDKQPRKSTIIVFSGRFITMVENSWPIDLSLSQINSVCTNKPPML
jgi:5-methylthioribose kinase